MQQGVGPAGLVGFTAALNFESAVGVEACGGFVLFVDVNSGDVLAVDCVGEECGANAVAALGCVDKQHFQVSVEDAGESHGPTIAFGD